MKSLPSCTGRKQRRKWRNKFGGNWSGMPENVEIKFGISSEIAVDMTMGKQKTPQHLATAAFTIIDWRLALDCQNLLCYRYTTG